MRAIDWSAIYVKYRGQWVALTADEQSVVGFGKTAQAALAQAERQGCERPILTRMPEELMTYVGGGV